MVQIATRQYRDQSVTRPKLDNSVRNWPITEIDHTDSPYTVVPDDLLILVDTSVNQVQVKLTFIGSVPDGRWVVIKDAANNAGTYAIQVDPNGSTIDGSAASLSLAGNSNSVTLVKGPTGWSVLTGEISSLEFDLPLVMPMGEGVEVHSSPFSPEEGAPYTEGVLGDSGGFVYPTVFPPEEGAPYEDGLNDYGLTIITNRDTGTDTDGISPGPYNFSLLVPAGRTITPGSVSLSAPGVTTAVDDGAGNFSAPASGTITYSTGLVAVTFDVAGSGGDIIANYTLDAP